MSVFTQRHDREFYRKTTGLIYPVFHRFGEFTKVGVAGRKFGPGVADADDGPAVEFVGGNTLVLHPGPVNESILAFATNQSRLLQLMVKNLFCGLKLRETGYAGGMHVTQAGQARNKNGNCGTRRGCLEPGREGPPAADPTFSKAGATMNFPNKENFPPIPQYG